MKIYAHWSPGGGAAPQTVKLQADGKLQIGDLAREFRALSPRSSRLPTCDVMIKPATGLTVQLSEEDIDDPRVPSKMKANTLMVLYEVCCSSQIVTLSALLHCVVLLSQPLLMKLKVPS